MATRRDRKSGAPEEETFLGRWSRRKAEARTQPTVEDKAADPAEPSPEDPTPDGPGRVIRAEDLPDVESLTAASDFKVFMQEGVPDELKARALRKLWRLKPSLANLDGLVDYGGDFTRSGVGAAGIKTAYQVGRGFLDRVDEAKATPEPAPEGVSRGATRRLAEPADDPPPEPRPADPEAPEATRHAEVEAEPAGEPPAPARRRPLPRRR